MIGTILLATGHFATCEDDGCEKTAMVVVGPRHLCPHHAWEEEQCWKSLAHLGLRPMSAAEDAERKGGQ